MFSAGRGEEVGEEEGAGGEDGERAGDAGWEGGEGGGCLCCVLGQSLCFGERQGVFEGRTAGREGED